MNSRGGAGRSPHSSSSSPAAASKILALGNSEGERPDSVAAGSGLSAAQRAPPTPQGSTCTAPGTRSDASTTSSALPPSKRRRVGYNSSSVSCGDSHHRPHGAPAPATPSKVQTGVLSTPTQPSSSFRPVESSSRKVAELQSALDACKRRRDRDADRIQRLEAQNTRLRKAEDGELIEVQGDEVRQFEERQRRLETENRRLAADVDHLSSLQSIRSRKAEDALKQKAIDALKIEQLAEDNRRLEAESNRVRVDNERLREENKNLSSMVEVGRRADFNARIAADQEAFDALKIEQLERDKERQEGEAEQLRSENERLRKENERLEKDYEGFRATTLEMIDRHASGMREARRQAEVIEAKLALLCSTNTEQAALIGTQKEQLAAVPETKRQALDDESARLNTQAASNAEASAEIDRLRKANEKQVAEITTLKNTRGAQAREINDLRAAKDEQELELGGLRQAFAGAKDLAKQLDAAKAERDATKAAVAARYRDLARTIAARDTEVLNLKKDLDDSKAQVADLTKGLDAAKADLAEAMVQLDAAKAEVKWEKDLADKQFVNWQLRRDQLSGRHADMVRAVRMLERELAGLNRELASRDKMITDEREEEDEEEEGATGHHRQDTESLERQYESSKEQVARHQSLLRVKLAEAFDTYEATIKAAVCADVQVDARVLLNYTIPEPSPTPSSREQEKIKHRLQEHLRDPRVQEVGEELRNQAELYLQRWRRRAGSQSGARAEETESGEL